MAQVVGVDLHRILPSPVPRVAVAAAMIDEAVSDRPGPRTVIALPA